MGTPTRFTYGATTVAKGKPLGDYPLQSPFNSSSDVGYGVASYVNDFQSTVAEYTVTGTRQMLFQTVLRRSEHLS